MKRILITGCSSGIGLALVNLYLTKEYKVFGISRTKPNISNENFSFLSCDLSDISNIKKNCINFIKEIKNLDLVFLNAGMLGDIKELKDTSINELQNVMNLNVYANKELIETLEQIEVKNILAISSGASKNGSLGWGAYSLSKAGLNMLINLYAKEYTNTKFLSIAPGVVKTPMTDYIRQEIDEEKFTSVKRLKSGEILSTEDAVKRIDEKIINCIEKFESGDFIDVRNI